MLQRIVQFEHGDLSPEEQQRIVTNRMSHGTRRSAAHRC
jgi:hypothetical protein